MDVPEAEPVDRERRGRRWLVVSFLFCPCHLPLIMGAAMLIQQKLNPAPTDPVQARVMQVMPVMFTVFFAFFPAGLVLYWVTNTVLSIAQQWQVNRVVEAEAKAQKAGKKKG